MAFPEKKTRKTPKGKKAPKHQDAALRGKQTKTARKFVKDGTKRRLVTVRRSKRTWKSAVSAWRDIHKTRGYPPESTIRTEHTTMDWVWVVDLDKV